ncbi:UNVERIFIED_CONTAM: SMP-30/gluconolactonase/LRE family protein [Microbacterium sp. SLM126]
MNYATTIAVHRRASCGEGPVWDPATGDIHWVDIIDGEVLRTSLSRGETTVNRHDGMVGAVAPRAGGGIVGAVADGFVGWDAAGEIERRTPCLADGIRMNDAKVDARGRLWAGDCAIDFAPGAGGLWMLDAGWTATRVMGGFTLPNGLDWNPSGDVFYLVESMGRQVLRYVWDPDRGPVVETRSVLIDSGSFAGLPDGLCVDADGHLWIAEFGAGCVHQYTAEGERVQTIQVPTAQPTSCAFVGPNLDELWVTSAASGSNTDADPDAGSLFRITGLGVTGRTTPRFAG